MGARFGFGVPSVKCLVAKKFRCPQQMKEPEFGWTVQGTMLLQQFQLLIFREITS
jgi:hypothetical protein